MKKDSAHLAVLRLKLLAVFVILSFGATAFGQGQQHYGSPLYAPRVYDPAQTDANGLPKALEKVGIEQRLGERLPLDARFTDENGNRVRLGDYFGKEKPVILALVYFECPMLCNEVLNGLTGSLRGISFNAGKEFDVVAISFDARENGKAELVKNKKAAYLKRYERPATADGWHFLTGTQEEIDKVTQAVGFNYALDEKSDQFAHAGGVIVVSPEGKISKYFYGIDYAPKDLKFGIMESAAGKIGNPAEQLLLYCFHYDPATGKYGLAIMNVIRLGAILTLLVMIGAFVFWRFRKGEK
jgi:protein SCO1